MQYINYSTKGAPPATLNRLGMLLKKAGYRDVRRGEQRTRGWIVYERTLDEVNANRNKKE